MQRGWGARGCVKIGGRFCPQPSESRWNMADTPWKTYMCLICGFIYDEASGLPTRASRRARAGDVPPNWTCPECNARKGTSRWSRSGPDATARQPTRNTAWTLPA